MFRRGFTVIEIATTLTVMLVLAGIATASWSVVIARHASKAAESRLELAAQVEANWARTRGGFTDDLATLAGIGDGIVWVHGTATSENVSVSVDETGDVVALTTFAGGRCRALRIEQDRVNGTTTVARGATCDLEAALNLTAGVDQW